MRRKKLEWREHDKIKLQETTEKITVWNIQRTENGMKRRKKKKTYWKREKKKENGTDRLKQKQPPQKSKTAPWFERGTRDPVTEERRRERGISAWRSTESKGGRQGVWGRIWAEDNAGDATSCKIAGDTHRKLLRRYKVWCFGSHVLDLDLLLLYLYSYLRLFMKPVITNLSDLYSSELLCCSSLLLSVGSNSSITISNVNIFRN